MRPVKGWVALFSPQEYTEVPSHFSQHRAQQKECQQSNLRPNKHYYSGLYLCPLFSVLNFSNTYSQNYR